MLCGIGLRCFLPCEKQVKIGKSIKKEMSLIFFKSITIAFKTLINLQFYF
jgi:hypothetical protein